MYIDDCGVRGLETQFYPVLFSYIHHGQDQFHRHFPPSYQLVLRLVL